WTTTRTTTTGSRNRTSEANHERAASPAYARYRCPRRPDSGAGDVGVRHEVPGIPAAGRRRGGGVYRRADPELPAGQLRFLAAVRLGLAARHVPRHRKAETHHAGDGTSSRPGSQGALTS